VSCWVRLPQFRAALMSGDVWLGPAKSGGLGTWFGPGFAGPLGRWRFHRGNPVHRRHDESGRPSSRRV